MHRRGGDHLGVVVDDEAIFPVENYRFHLSCFAPLSLSLSLKVREVTGDRKFV